VKVSSKLSIGQWTKRSSNLEQEAIGQDFISLYSAIPFFIQQRKQDVPAEEESVLL
jgi:hypothetical protein